MDMYIGCYGDRIARVGVRNARLTLLDETKTPSASYLYRQSDLLYSVEETQQSALHVWRIRPDGGLTHLQELPTGGADACHLTSFGDLLLLTNYSSGTIARFALNESGIPERAVAPLHHRGNGPIAGRQESAHPHQVLFTPNGRYLTVCDLGVDGVAFYSAKSLHEETPSPVWVHTPAGCGPRHAAFGPNEWWYVACELSSELLVYRGYAEQARLIARLAQSPSFVNYPSSLRLCAKGLLIANRGANTLALYTIGNGGLPREYMRGMSGGNWPRDAAFSPDGQWIAVANQQSDRLTLMNDQVEVIDQLTLPAPACVLWTRTP